MESFGDPSDGVVSRAQIAQVLVESLTSPRTTYGRTGPASSSSSIPSSVGWDLASDALELPAPPGLTLTALTAEPGSPAADALALLASWVTTNPVRSGAYRA